MARRKIAPRPRRANDSELALPVAPNSPSPDMNDYCYLIFGEKGVGKSTLAAMFESVRAHFMWEPGRRGLAIPLIPARGERPLTWPRFKQYVDLLIADAQVGRVVIDTADRLAMAADLAHAQAISPTLKTVANINDYGKSWNELKQDVEGTLSRLIWAGFPLTFISHVRVRPRVIRSMSREELMQKAKEGEIPETIQPTCPGWMWEIIKVLADFSFYYGYDNYDRVLHIRGHEGIETSCGVEGRFFQPKGEFNRSGEPLHILPMGSSPQESYQNLCLAWENRLEGYFHDTVDSE